MIDIIFLFIIFMITLAPVVFEFFGFDEIEKLERGLFKIFS